MALTSDKFAGIGNIEVREATTVLYSCLAAYLRFRGMPILVDRLLAIAPLRKCSVSPRVLKFITRRIGITIHEVGHQEIVANLANGPILVERSISQLEQYYLIIFDFDESNLIAFIPGYSQTVCSVPIESDVLDNFRAAYQFTDIRQGPALVERFLPPKLWLLPWAKNYQATYDSHEIEEIRHSLGTMPPTTNAILN